MRATLPDGLLRLPLATPSATSSARAASWSTATRSRRWTNIKQHLRIYPLAAGGARRPRRRSSTSRAQAFNTIHAMDFSFFEEVNDVVQEEPNAAIDPETLGLLAVIGIEKGKPFAPDARMQRDPHRGRRRWATPPRARSPTARASGGLLLSRTAPGAPRSSAAVTSSSSTTACGCSTRARSCSSTPPASRRRWP